MVVGAADHDSPVDRLGHRPAESPAPENLASRTILMIDTSGSMRAVDTSDGRTRLEHAKDIALARIDALHGGGLSFPHPAKQWCCLFR